MKKKKILLMSDDIRIPSGVGTVSNALVCNTADKYDWVQIGGAVKHPEAGKVFDMSKSIQEKYGHKDVYCKVYPVDGYGNEQILRTILNNEKPDAIIHFTDPRFWKFLYQMEHEIRQNIPIMYLNIWDDLPYPHWNEDFYESCDMLMAISKQTYNINRNVCRRKPRVEEKDLFYVQHGIDENVIFPLENKNEKEYLEFKNAFHRGTERNFVALFNSRNIHRKRVSDLILAYSKLCSTLTKEEADKCLLILHTDAVDQHGTDLPAVVKALCPYPVAFSEQKLPPNHLNYLYNLADVVCNPSSAEGFGLTHMEGMMAGTPTIATVVGGLQDQMGFKVNDRELSVNDFTTDIPSNSTGKISKIHGEWTYPLWPQMNLQGSPLTPYIYDSRVSVDQIFEGLKYWYNMDKKEREAKGLAGRKWAIKNKFTHKGMCEAAIEAIDTCFENFKPRKRFTLIDTKIEPIKYDSGVLI